MVSIDATSPLERPHDAAEPMQELVPQSDWTVGGCIGDPRRIVLTPDSAA